VSPVRVLLVGLPTMLRDLVAGALAGNPDVEVAGDLARVAGVGKAVSATGATVVVTASDDGAVPATFTRLLHDHPWLRVVALTPDGRRGTYAELRPHDTPLGDVTPERLAETIARRV
jgi:hypothetical protein